MDCVGSAGDPIRLTLFSAWGGALCATFCLSWRHGGGRFLLSRHSCPGFGMGSDRAIGGTIVAGFLKGVLPEMGELRRLWRIGTAGILALIALMALVAQKTVFSNPTFVQRWVWTNKGEGAAVTLAGRWQGVLGGQRVKVRLYALGANRFVGRVEGLSGHGMARVEGRLNGDVVVLKIVSPAGGGRGRQEEGYIDSSGKGMQGWERDRQGRRLMWRLNRL